MGRTRAVTLEPPHPSAAPAEACPRPAAAAPAPRARRRFAWGALLVVSAAAVFLALPTLAGVPARLADSCGGWIAAAGVLELLSAVGFVLLFKLVFAAPVTWRQGLPAALCGLGASTVLPGGGLIGPSLGAWSQSATKPSPAQLTRSTITFVILTNAPAAIVLAVVGTLLWLGVPAGPHETALTIIPALVALTLLSATWVAGHACGRQRHPRALGRALAAPGQTISDGMAEARGLTRDRNWKLNGAVAYYAFDNAVLWAAFHAFGAAPQLGIIVMGYLVGSLAGALPLPAGLGAVDGGLVGALLLYGAPPAPTVGAVLVYRGISLALPIVLGAIGWTWNAAERPPATGNVWPAKAS
ncbi:MAG TPA: lysylphosphatidylglycerol synthase transmembrane domain-containing protein [Solirubrobacteraceae bacterium]